MDANANYLNGLINENKNLFSQYPDINWVNPYVGDEFQQHRDELLLRNPAALFKQTKPYHKQISKGCQLCGQGLWSCLFITNRCNANCFYCPTSQTDDEVPSTQGLDFPSADAYAAYINHFGFKGVAFSGGEPLLYLNRVLEYLKAVRTQCAPDLYIWMYTNGLLAKPRSIQALADAGLNEIRFDIGATRYMLDMVKIAKGIIPVVTIEIPAVPEEKEQLMQLLPRMADAGVSNLNLHQLRLTPHNAPRLLKRNYTYIPAERPIVLESELAALEIIDYAREQQIDIGINYCSFYYKHRFQKAGFRRQIAAKHIQKDEFITENGFIRSLNGNELRYDKYVLSQQNKNLSATQISIGKENYNLYRVNASKLKIDSTHIDELRQMLKDEPQQPPIEQELFEAWQHEYIEKGLRAY